MRVVFGASGHGKVVADGWIAAVGSIDGFLDDDPSKAGSLILGIPIVGGVNWLRSRGSAQSIEVALGIGDNHARRAVAARCCEVGASLATVVHPRAIVAPSAVLAPGVVVLGGAVVNADARVDEGAIVNTAAVVEHDCVVGAFAHVSPNSTMGGGATMGRLAQLGIGACLLPRVRVGEGAVIGGAAVVVRDIDSWVVAAGVPARSRRKLLPRF